MNASPLRSTRRPQAVAPAPERAFAELRRSLASGHKRPMLQMPTGSGKTLTSAHIVAGALGKGKRVAFCVPRLTLIDQTVARSTLRASEPSASCRATTP